MMQVKKGDVVRVHYTGTLTDGSQFDSSVGRNPLEFTVGAGQMIAGFDAGVLGMVVGEKKTLQIDPDNGYGQSNPEAIIEFPKTNVPEGMELEVGMQLNLQNEYGQPVPVVIIELREDLVVMDANHSLAGKDLIFEVELVEIAS
ncbi:MAG: peptidylprolyl isomerase [Chitinophagaceae bacterium]|nr:MAG: peptidylprolyl isomerase [Chitinophagaceae bacterium]